MNHDLLIDPINTVFAVNCRVEGDTLHCGALYLEPLVQSHHIRLIRSPDSGAMLTIELPEELIQQPDAYRAWQVALPILSNVEVREPSLRT